MGKIRERMCWRQAHRHYESRSGSPTLQSCSRPHSRERSKTPMPRSCSRSCSPEAISHVKDSRIIARRRSWPLPTSSHDTIFELGSNIPPYGDYSLYRIDPLCGGLSQRRQCRCETHHGRSRSKIRSYHKRKHGRRSSRGSRNRSRSRGRRNRSRSRGRKDRSRSRGRKDRSRSRGRRSRSRSRGRRSRSRSRGRRSRSRSRGGRSRSRSRGGRSRSRSLQRMRYSRKTNAYCRHEKGKENSNITLLDIDPFLC